jgi:2-dehydro-3-deoxyphosphogluconate aldolase/(4S)-4-hydroxy-2-oxoglutarate aldolase
MTANDVMSRIRRSGVVGIVRAGDPDTAREKATRLQDAGLPVLEISLTTPGALEVIRAAAARQVGIVGAGTVLNSRQATQVIEAGAQVVVTPAFDGEVLQVAVENDVACIPGCLTPTEMLNAMRLGAHAVKIFPAHLWSPEALAGLLEAMPELVCVPTGGVSPSSAPAWIQAGAAAVGVGSSLTSVGDTRTVVDSLLGSIAAVRSSG